MLGYYSPERLDIVVDNPGLTFPENVEYRFVFEEHDSASSQVVQDIVTDSDVYAPEFPNVYSPDCFKDFQRALRIADEIMRGTVTVGDNEWLRTFHFSPTAVPYPSMNLYTEISRYRASGIVFRPIDSIVDDPASCMRQVTNSYGTPYEYNPFWLIAEAPVRDSLMLRQLATIGGEQKDLRNLTRIAVVCGLQHWPIAIAAKFLGANVTKTYAVEGGSSEIADPLLLPYFKERFCGRSVLSPTDFLQILYTYYHVYMDSKEFNSVLPLIGN